MRIDGNNPHNNSGIPLDLSRLQVGQRVKVEILQNAQNREGTIALGGKIFPAKLEANVQTGEKFWASVRETSANGIVLSRDSMSADKAQNLSKEQITILVNRGFGLDSNISGLLGAFTERVSPQGYSLLSSQHPALQNLIQVLKSIMPQWSQISGQNYDQLITFFSRLGLDYENLIYQSYKRKGTGKKPIIDPNDVKLHLLRLMSDESLPQEEQALLKMLLDELTGQQLWAQSGANNNAFFLMHFPLLNQDQFYYCVLAFESARRGQKIDFTHCHLALQVETANLNTIGVDVRLYENRIHLLVLHDDVLRIKPLIDLGYLNLKQRFAEYGVLLEGVAVKTFEEVPHFTKFIRGEPTGVDVKG